MSGAAGFDLDPVPRLATRSDETEGNWRFAGQQFGLNLNEGLEALGLEDLRRIRADKAIPRSFGSSYGQASLRIVPENSEPGYTESGSYQPAVAYGA